MPSLWNDDVYTGTKDEKKEYFPLSKIPAKVNLHEDHNMLASCLILFFFLGVFLLSCFEDFVALEICNFFNSLEFVSYFSCSKKHFICGCIYIWLMAIKNQNKILISVETMINNVIATMVPLMEAKEF